VENCETSALGRALANGGFAAKGKRPSREEMQKVERRQAEPVVSPEILALAQEALDQVAGIESIEELKDFYTGAKDDGLLAVVVNGKTLNSAITARKTVLEKK